MLIFIDSDNQIAYFTNEEDDIIKAYFNENIDSETEDLEEDDEDNIEVGEIEVTEEDDEEKITCRWLQQVDVNEEYQNRGIGTQLVELAVEHLALDRIKCVKEIQEVNYCLTVQGEYLIARCVRRGVVEPNMCIFEGGSYDSGIVSAAIIEIDPDFFEIHENEDQENTDIDHPESEEEYEEKEEKKETKTATHLLSKDSPLSKSTPKKEDSDDEPEQSNKFSMPGL